MFPVGYYKGAEKLEPRTLSVGMQSAAAIRKQCAVLQKLKTELLWDPAIPLPVFVPVFVRKA